ncbi:MAG: hypothetical protein WD032_03600 [Nitrospirales bacterium]
MQQQNRPLTHDEKKAAEAAFKGASFDPKWSEAARKVYLGLSSAIANKRHEAFEEIHPSKPTTVSKRTMTEIKERSRVQSSLW